MDLTFLWVCLAVILDGIAGLVGGLLPFEFLHRNISKLLAFAAGTLLGAAFLDLLPEAFSGIGSFNAVMGATLCGFVLFFIIQKLLGSHAPGQHGHGHHKIGALILIGDALHNAADGVAIAVAFKSGVEVGISTAFAVIIHELPQEIGDYSILIAQGYSKSKALLSLFFVQLSALIGALGALWFSNEFINLSHYLMAISAGGFLYVAAANIIPEMKSRKSAPREQLTYVICIALGILVLFFAQKITHTH